MTYGRRYFIPEALVRRTWAFLREHGAHRQEGMALWGGRTDGDPILVTKLVVPAQTAVRTAAGVCVAMAEQAKLGLRSQLRRGEHLVIRVHSHPGRAFHSRTDDENLVISHDGAISIVVPSFARDMRDDLTGAAVYEYAATRGWSRLTPRDLAERFVVQ